MEIEKHVFETWCALLVSLMFMSLMGEKGFSQFVDPGLFGFYLSDLLLEFFYSW